MILCLPRASCDAGVPACAGAGRTTTSDPYGGSVILTWPPISVPVLSVVVRHTAWELNPTPVPDSTVSGHGSMYTYSTCRGSHPLTLTTGLSGSEINRPPRMSARPLRRAGRVRAPIECMTLMADKTSRGGVAWRVAGGVTWPVGQTQREAGSRAPGSAAAWRPGC